MRFMFDFFFLINFFTFQNFHFDFFLSIWLYIKKFSFAWKVKINCQNKNFDT